MITGFDISRWNGHGAVDKCIKENKDCKFIIIKATEGKTYTDPRFIENVKAAYNAKVIIGLYHYARPENNMYMCDAINFINAYMNAVQICGTDYPVFLALDWEGNSLKCDLNWAQKWLSFVKDIVGLSPLFYTSQSYVKHCTLIANGGWKLWVARYNSKKYLGDIKPFKSYTIWQYTDTPIDTNEFPRSADEMAKELCTKVFNEENNESESENCCHCCGHSTRKDEE